MEKRQYQRKRNIHLKIMVDENERDLIHKRMKLSGIKSLRVYMLKQALEGRIITVELDSVNEMVRLLSNATNNINQIARKANQTGNICKNDIENIRERFDELWEQTNEILRRLSELE